MPVLILYSIYSFIFDYHTSFYSYTIECMTICVFSFGSIRLTPQLFINYQMKSVKSIDWKKFWYKWFNSLVKIVWLMLMPMPNLYRFAQFREIVVMLLFLIQWCIYKEARNATVQPKKDQ